MSMNDELKSKNDLIVELDQLKHSSISTILDITENFNRIEEIANGGFNQLKHIVEQLVEISSVCKTLPIYEIKINEIREIIARWENRDRLDQVGE